MLYRAIFLFITLITLVLQVEAAPVLFKNKAAFDAAVAGLNNVQVETIDFESQVPKTTIPDGSSIQGLTVNENLPGTLEIIVRDVVGGSTSGFNSLGVSDSGVAFALGDIINFSFAASHAFGLYIVVEEGFPFFDNDVNLTFAGVTLSNLSADILEEFTDDFDALWVGIVDSDQTATHTSATLRFGPIGAPIEIIIGDIDDITFTRSLSPPPPPTVSEPSMIFLIGAGLLGFYGLRRRW